MLDVACGRGAVLFPAAQAVGPTGYVTGIDLAEVMVRETQQEAQRRKRVNVEAQQMDAENLQFVEESFDYVLSGLALLFFPQPQRALSEMRRVLKPSGHLALSTWDRHGDDLWKWFEEDLFTAYMPPTDKTIQPQEPQTPMPLELDTPEGLDEAICRAGFTDVQVVAESVDMIYNNEQEWWEALWGTSCRLMLEEIKQATGPDGLEKFRLAVFAHLGTIRQADGIHQVWPVLFAVANKPQV